MPRQTLAIVVLLIGLVETLLLFPMVLYGFYWDVPLVVLTSVAIIVSSAIWRYAPWKLMTSCIFATWLCLYIFIVLHELLFVFDPPKTGAQVSLAMFESILWSLMWFIALLVPVGVIFLGTRQAYRRRNASRSLVER